MMRGKAPPPREGHDPSFLLESAFSKDSGIAPAAVYRNACPAVLYELALRHEPGVHLTACGALATDSGAKRGRSPGDRRVVREPGFEEEVWWGPGSPNIEMDPRTFLANREAAVDFLNTLPRVYVVDAFACWDPCCRLKVRLVTGRAAHALFLRNMLIRPSAGELGAFGEPDFVIYDGGPFPANKYYDHVSSSTSVAVSLGRREMVVLGTEYAGEMKKGVFTLLHYWLPRREVLFTHSGCNAGEGGGDVALFLGLSGTGKTALSNDPRRRLIGDDEHCWGPSGVFNIEGGCYAKALHLSRDREPDLFGAVRFGTLLENVTFHPETREVDFDDDSLTENTRCCFPIDHIRNAAIPCVGGHPANLLLLTCDAFGVLPPVSRLTLPQALFHFVCGYTAKVAGTEDGVAEPAAAFSPCFAGAFLVWPPLRYAEVLGDKLRRHGTRAWLVNTGWCGGRCGAGGSRIPLEHTRAIVSAIHSGELLGVEYNSPTPIFGLQVPSAVSGVPPDLLRPERMWASRGCGSGFHKTLGQLAAMFQGHLEGLLAADAGGGGAGAGTTARLVAAGGPRLPAAEAGAPGEALAARGASGSGGAGQGSETRQWMEELPLPQPEQQLEQQQQHGRSERCDLAPAASPARSRALQMAS